MDKTDFIGVYLNGPFYEFTHDEVMTSSEAFWKFSDRFNSLHRLWVISELQLKDHLSLLSSITEKDFANWFNSELELSKKNHPQINLDDVMLTGGEWDVVCDGIKADEEYALENLLSSTLSAILANFETMLNDLTKELAVTNSLDHNIDSLKPRPHIDRYIIWMIEQLGIEDPRTKALNKEIDLFRQIRNKYMHSINRTLPQEIQKAFLSLIPKNGKEQFSLTTSVVNRAFECIATLSKKIEEELFKFMYSGNKTD